MTFIPFTQYLRPNGRTKPITIDRPDNISALAHKIIEAGYQFEAEVITTGDASFTITGPEGDEDIEIAFDGKDVSGAVDRLVMRFAKQIGLVEPSDV